MSENRWLEKGMVATLISLIGRCLSELRSFDGMPEIRWSANYSDVNRDERVDSSAPGDGSKETVASISVRLKTIGTVGLWVGLSLFSGAAWAQTSPCDLNHDGTINAADVQLAIEMALGSVPCSANIGGIGVCNVAVVQRVINAALGQACNTGGGATPHFVSLSWTASTSLNIAGYNVYRGSASSGPYAKITAALVVAGTSYTDSTVLAGQTYYYVCTAMDTSNNESAYSNAATAMVSTP